MDLEIWAKPFYDGIMAIKTSFSRVLPAAALVLFLSGFIPLWALGTGEEQPVPESSAGRNSFEQFTVIIPRLKTSHPLKGNPDEGELLVLCQLFRGLVAINPETGEVEPDLAGSWVRNEDGTTYRFTLRESRWSDGSPVTAEDYRSSIIHMLETGNGSGGRTYLSRFLKGASGFMTGGSAAGEPGVRVIDERTLELEFARAYPYALKLLAHYAFLLYPEEFFRMDSYGFQALRRIPTSGAVLTPPGDEKDITGMTLIPGAETAPLFRFIETDSDEKALDLYLKGQGDWLASGAVPLSRLYEIDYRRDFSIQPGLTSYFYFLNTGRQPLKDPGFRKRLVNSADRETLVNQVLRGGQLPSDTLVPPGFYSLTEGYRKPPEKLNLPGESFDLPGSAESSSPLKLIYPSDEGHRMTAEFLVRHWADSAGIAVEPVPLEWIDFLKARELGDYHIALGGWKGEYDDPMSFLSLFLSVEKRWGGVYGNSGFDELILKAEQLADGRERRELLHDAESLLVRDSALIPLFFTGYPRLIDTDRWKGSPRLLPGSRALPDRTDHPDCYRERSQPDGP